MGLMVFLVVEALFAAALVFVMVTSLVSLAKTRVPYVRTRAADIREIAARVGITRQDTFFDLGSGDGKVVFMVEQISGAQGTGFELTIWPHLLARLEKFLRRSSARFVRGDFFHHDLSRATVIYTYLYPHLMSRIGDKVKNECQPGTRVVSRDFPIRNLERTDYWRSATGHDIYLYQI